MFNIFNRGSMLTGSEIMKQVKKGNIEIEPYNPERVNPNSYNLSLNKELCIYARGSKRLNVVPNTEPVPDPIESSVEIESDTDNYGTVRINDYNIEVPIMMLQSKPDISMNFDQFPSFESLNTVDLSPIDSRARNEVIRFEIPETGLLLYPGVLYIGRTNERIATDKYIPMINGRSSGGRLGLSVHICAGFGDIGFDGTFTLEISVVEPLIIYPNMEVAQVCFHTPCGKTDILYRGKYYKQTDATPSRMWHENPRVVPKCTYEETDYTPYNPEKD